MKELFAESRYLKMAAAAIAAVMVICAIALSLIHISEPTRPY